MPTTHYSDDFRVIYIVWETSADIPEAIYNYALDAGMICNYGNYENAIEVELF